MAFFERIEIQGVAMGLGAQTGAIVVWAPKYWKGKDIKVRPEGSGYSDWKWTVPIAERSHNGELAYVAVFPRLPEGTYVVRHPSSSDKTISVFGGYVAEVDWR